MLQSTNFTPEFKDIVLDTYSVLIVLALEVNKYLMVRAKF